MSESDRTSCKICRTAHDVPPCDDCFPNIHSYNEGVFLIYNECGDQYLMGSMGAVGLNMLAIELAMEYLDIDKKERLHFNREVRRFGSIVINERQKETK